MKFAHLVAGSAIHMTRVLKESRTLLNHVDSSEGFIVGHQEGDLPFREEVFDNLTIFRHGRPYTNLPKGKLFAVLKTISYIFEAKNALLRLKPNLIFAHSVTTLPSSIKAGRALNVPVIYDCHELETKTIGAIGAWGKFVEHTEAQYLPQADAVMVVNDSIADWYEERYGFRPFVLKALPDPKWQKASGNVDYFRKSFSIAATDTIFLYQGLLSYGRRIEQLIRVFKQLPPNKHLVFLGYGDIEGCILEASQETSNIHFHTAVPSSELLSLTASADVGISGVENKCLSYYFCLPNKILEYLQAGIPFICPDYPEMARLQEETGAGWTHGESDHDIIQLIDSIKKEDIVARAELAKESASRYTWESQEEAFIQLVDRVLIKHGTT